MTLNILENSNVKVLYPVRDLRGMCLLSSLASSENMIQTEKNESVKIFSRLQFEFIRAQSESMT